MNTDLIFSSASSALKTERISRVASFSVKCSVEEAFPLFGPVREAEWAEGWTPEILFGYSDVEEYMLFRTHGGFSDEPFYTWAVTRYHPETHRIEYTVSSRDRIWFVLVHCTRREDVTDVNVRYTYTGFTEEASQRNSISMEKIFHNNLKDWEEAINHYLSTGTKRITS